MTSSLTVYDISARGALGSARADSAAKLAALDEHARKTINAFVGKNNFALQELRPPNPAELIQGSMQIATAPYKALGGELSKWYYACKYSPCSNMLTLFPHLKKQHS